jgi:hypothetical protein
LWRLFRAPSSNLRSDGAEIFSFEESRLSRPDISRYLVHFTKGTDDQDAIGVLKGIVSERRILGGRGHVRGGHGCVCFTESPLQLIAGRLVNDNGYSRYSPFGIMFDKRYVFGLGGRPVIYGPASEYETLSDHMQWRHVRYEPDIDQPVDFTWEREWRVLADEVTFTPDIARIVVPDRTSARQLAAGWEQAEDYKIELYSLLMDEHLAIQYREPWPWDIIVLSE